MIGYRQTDRQEVGSGGCVTVLSIEKRSKKGSICCCSGCPTVIRPLIWVYVMLDGQCWVHKHRGFEWEKS